ncbi:hypothetical protein DICA3_B01816 [Diutina catenulata]
MSTCKVREDLIVPYKHVPTKPRNESSAMIAQSLPMAAMFMRNRMLSWTAVFLATQAFLNEPRHKPAADKDSAQQPASLRLVFALLSLVTCYIDLIFPSMSPQARSEQMAAKAAETAAETVASAVSTAVETAVETASSKGWWPL